MKKKGSKTTQEQLTFEVLNKKIKTKKIHKITMCTIV